LPSQGAQVRAGLAWSPIDRLKGEAIEQAAEAECDALSAREVLEEVLTQGTSFGETGALRVQSATLESGLTLAGPLLERSRERFAHGIDTLFDVDELESRVARLRSDLEGARRRLAELESQGTPEVAAPMSRLVADYERAAMASTKARSDERRLEAWRVDLRAGAVPWPKTDWFGMASVSWSLGAGAQARSERAVLGARAEELEGARDELRSRVARFSNAVRDGLPALERELSVTRDQWATIRARQALAGEGSDAMARFKDRYLLESVGVEARVRYLETLVAARRAVLENS
jgi:outer membrane protein TolC